MLGYGNFRHQLLGSACDSRVTNSHFWPCSCFVKANLWRQVNLCRKRFEERNWFCSPPVLPHQFVKLRGRDLSITVQTHRERLLSRWSLTKIDLIEQQFDSLLVAYQSEEAFKNALENCGAATGFKEGWLLTGGRFPELQDFCGGLATVFPGTATVESDFSVLKYAKNDYRTALTDFSLEGILHAKQFRMLQAIDTQQTIDSHIKNIDSHSLNIYTQ